MHRRSENANVISVNGKTYLWKYSRTAGAIVFDGDVKHVCRWNDFGFADRVTPAMIKDWIEKYIVNGDEHS